MDRKQLDTLLPMLYGLAVVVCALWLQGGLVAVAVIGAILLGIYYGVFRGRMLGGDADGRRRNRLRR